MARQLKITVDYNVCVGNAMCETFATNTFGLNERPPVLREGRRGRPGGYNSGSG